ncbi:Glycosyl transferase family 2 [Sinosporangium album]|uniref:Glycosyl transferase family 2 n=1 Tax=Sinosporangium album TaxID=504805 RepID=A0A1G7V190_9ACTN|nr:glycosyltransferase [Sinosporangium album]SDG53635.1 Glycosyl transferase family 2 [Sinosporangium album]
MTDAPDTPPTPQGFLRTPSEPPGDLSWADGRPEIAGAPVPEPATAAFAAGLRGRAGLRVVWPDRPAPVSPLLTALASAGVPLFSAEAPAWARQAEPVLTGLLTAWTPPERPDDSLRSLTDLRREEHSIRLRRHALGGGRTNPAVSVLMSSMRPAMLASALRQMERQRGVEVEVLLGLHGTSVEDAAVRRAVAECRLPITVVEAGREVPFGEVLNRAADKADAGIIAKWDDDDWYSPEHLSDLLMARKYSGTEVVGVAPEFFYLEPLVTTVRRTDYSSEVWTDHVAGGTIMLETAMLREVGGFEPEPRGVDARLLAAARRAGGRIYRTHGLGYVLRRALGDHTWRLPLAHFLRRSSRQWHGFRPSQIMETM